MVLFHAVIYFGTFKDSGANFDKLNSIIASGKFPRGNKDFVRDYA
jgi:hypothetical protein